MEYIIPPSKHTNCRTQITVIFIIDLLKFLIFSCDMNILSFLQTVKILNEPSFLHRWADAYLSFLQTYQLSNPKEYVIFIISMVVTLKFSWHVNHLSLFQTVKILSAVNFVISFIQRIGPRKKFLLFSYLLNILFILLKLP